MKTNEEPTRLKAELHKLIDQVEDVQALHAVQYLLSRIETSDAFLGSFAFLKKEPDLYSPTDIQEPTDTP